MEFMTRRRFSDSRTSLVVCVLLIFGLVPDCVAAAPSEAAVSGFDAYIRDVESRLAQQHRSQGAFLASAASNAESQTRLRRGELNLEKVTPSAGADLPGAMLHHWRGTAFAAGAKAADFERLMKDFNDYPRYFSPQVLKARVLSQGNDHFRASMRVRQRHVITVVMDTTYDINFARVDAKHGYSISKSMQISEIESPGTATERALSSAEEHGFLWRLNTYWSYEERDGGLYMQIESVSLTRSIPRALDWAVRPFMASVPRESLEFTLRSVCNAIRK